MKGIFRDSNFFHEIWGFSDLDPSHELYSKDNKKVMVKLTVKTAPEIHLDEAVF